MSEFSRLNNILKQLFGLYLYACGAQRQLLSVLSHVGLSESYSTLTAKLTATAVAALKAGKDFVGRRTPGTLERLSQTMRQKARNVAATVTFGQVYDNINFSDKVAEQSMGKTSMSCIMVIVAWIQC